MSKKNHSVESDKRILDALKKLPFSVEDKKHNLTICLDNNKTRSNETRFEHIAKKYHQLKVRDIESVPDGIQKYIRFSKSKKHKETYYYLIGRKGNASGFIQIAVKLYEKDKKRAYVKTIFVTHKIKNE